MKEEEKNYLILQWIKFLNIKTKEEFEKAKKDILENIKGLENNDISNTIQ